MLPAPDICYRALSARDPRFDGRFVVGVLTTGIFCRPVCPAPTARRENTRYFASPAAALAAGYRPCRRCRPEAAPALPEWTLASDTVLRAQRLIDDGFLDERAVAELAAAVGVGVRHLTRLFLTELGASPGALARARRLQLARRLVDESDLGMTAVAMSAGYGSVRRFNDEFRAVFGEPPSASRRRRKPVPGGDVTLRLAVRRPFNAAWMFGFLSRRAIAGVESVDGACYRRRIDDHAEVEAALTDRGLRVVIPAAAVGGTAAILARLRRVFDLDADPLAIDDSLARQPRLAPLIKAAPGIRVPGVWDAFEGVVRAILGQQVSVDRATVLATRLGERFGGGVFPDPKTLASAEVAAIGIPGVRGRAVSEVARRVVAEGDAWLKDADRVRSAFAGIRGLGPWTAEYAAMRVGRDPDAFPDSDWGLLKKLGVKGAAARRWAEPCRPWRAYAVAYLWSTGGN